MPILMMPNFRSSFYASAAVFDAFCLLRFEIIVIIVLPPKTKLISMRVWLFFCLDPVTGDRQRVKHEG